MRHLKRKLGGLASLLLLGGIYTVGWIIVSLAVVAKLAAIPLSSKEAELPCGKLFEEAIERGDVWKLP